MPSYDSAPYAGFGTYQDYLNSLGENPWADSPTDQPWQPDPWTGGDPAQPASPWLPSDPFAPGYDGSIGPGDGDPRVFSPQTTDPYGWSVTDPNNQYGVTGPTPGPGDVTTDYTHFDTNNLSVNYPANEIPAHPNADLLGPGNPTTYPAGGIFHSGLDLGIPGIASIGGIAQTAGLGALLGMDQPGSGLGGIVGVDTGGSGGWLGLGAGGGTLGLGGGRLSDILHPMGNAPSGAVDTSSTFPAPLILGTNPSEQPGPNSGPIGGDDTPLTTIPPIVPTSTSTPAQEQAAQQVTQPATIPTAPPTAQGPVYNTETPAQQVTQPATVPTAPPTAQGPVYNQTTPPVTIPPVINPIAPTNPTPENTNPATVPPVIGAPPTTSASPETPPATTVPPVTGTPPTTSTTPSTSTPTIPITVPTTTPMPTEPFNLDRNFLREGTQTNLDLSKLLPDIFKNYSATSGGYGQTDFNNYSGLLGGVGDANNTLTGFANAQTTGSNTALRTGNVNDASALGPQALSLLKQLNPNMYSSLDQANTSSGRVGQPSAIQTMLESQALDGLGLGRGLSQEDTRNAEQSARQAFNSRGLVNSNSAIAAEVLNKDSLGRQREAERRQFAQGVDATGYAQRQTGFGNTLQNAQLQSMYGSFNPFSTLTTANTQNQGLNQNLFGNTTGFSSGGFGNNTVNNLANPFAQYPQDVFSSNYNAANARYIAAGNNQAALAGAKDTGNAALVNSFLQYLGGKFGGG